MKHVKTYNQLNEAKTTVDEQEFETSYHYGSEAEAKNDLHSMGYRSKGYVNAGDGFEHIFIEQFDGPGEEPTPIARLVWLGNVQLKKYPQKILDGAKVTIIKPEHPQYVESKK